MENVVISVDLATLARHELTFLQEVDRHKELKREADIKQAIWRYEQFWLPLVQQQSSNLVPPLDVHWVWHCHMLSPRQYDKDCMLVVGCTVDHHIINVNSTEYAQQAKITEKLWSEKYGASEPYQCSARQSVSNNALVYESKCTYDLLQAVKRQSGFFYNISLPHYRDEKFLQTSFERYKKYLLLTKQNPSSFLVPCYDIDVMWHTHQLMTKAYRNDCNSLLGYLLNHDDTDTDRAPGSKLTDSFLNTRQLWKAAYGEEYSTSGAMYRGLPPDGKLNSLSVDQCKAVQTKTTKVSLTNLTLEGLDDVSKVKMAVNLYTDRPKLVCKLKGPPTVWENDVNGVGSFTVDTRIRRHNLLFQANTMKGNFLCFSNPNVYEFAYGDLEAEIEATKTTARTPSILMEARTRSTTKQKDGQQKTPSLIVTYRINPPTLGDMYLRADAGKFAKATMPETIEQMWGPIPLARLPEGVDNICAVATHGLVVDFQ